MKQTAIAAPSSGPSSGGGSSGVGGGRFSLDVTIRGHTDGGAANSSNIMSFTGNHAHALVSGGVDKNGRVYDSSLWADAPTHSDHISFSHIISHHHTLNIAKPASPKTPLQELVERVWADQDPTNAPVI